MKTSVLIIAHNEERHIAQCIKSVLNQTKEADEIVLIAHNCTDQTETIARAYPITTIPYNGPKGIIYARLEGLKHISGDIILCTDGDSYVARNWIETMSSLLIQGSVLVGSWMKLQGTFFGWLSNISNWYFCIRSPKTIERWVWGPSMGFWGKDISFVEEVFQKSILLQQKLGLTRNPDDYWLALFMKQRGTLAMTNKTHVTQHTKEVSSTEAIRRNRENMANAKKMDDYLITNPFS
jgi:glycosyltransferase involved in cell wall biosynthesis